MSISIIPRLNYKFTLKDLIISVKGLISKDADDRILKTIFKTDEIYYYNHARTAMRIALSALHLKSDAKIGIMAFNCLTVMNSVNSAGFQSIFIDVTDDFQLDLDDFNNKIDKIDALIINHLFGIPNKSILAIKEKYPSLPIIEDCAHSLMTKLNENFTGLYGDMSVFSYGRAKFPSVGDGGFMIVNNLKYKGFVEIENKILQPISFFEELKNILNSIILSILHYPFVYKNISLKYFKSVDNKKDVVGKYSTVESSFYKSNRYLFLSKIKNIDVQLQHQIENGHLIKNILTPKFKMYDGEYNFFMLPLLFENREQFIRFCFENGIEIGKHFSKTILWIKAFGYKEGNCPNAEKIADNIVTLPTYYRPKQILKLSNTLQNFFNE